MALDNLPFNDKQELLNHLKNDMGIDSGKLEEVAETIMEEAQSDEGNPENLLQSIKNGAKSLMTDIGLETVSWVENPSQDSMFVMMKNSDNKVRKTTGIYKEPEEDWKVAYGPVMRPNDIDKDGDVAPTTDIRKAAHEFIAEGRVNQFDTDHDLNTGKGTLVESWILKEDKKYELPNGETEVIEKGSWMVGVKPDQKVKERIENGEITGWSIFGQADQINLKNQPNFKTEQNNAFKQGQDTMSENQEQDNGEELSMKDVHSEVTELKSEFKQFMESPDPTTVKSKDDLVKTLENLEKEDETVLVELGKEVEITSKEPEMEDVSDLMDYLEDNLMEENFSMLMDAVRGPSENEEQEQVEEETDEDMEEEDEEKTAKHKANNSQGVGTGEEVSKGSNQISYKDLVGAQ